MFNNVWGRPITKIDTYSTSSITKTNQIVFLLQDLDYANLQQYEITEILNNESISQEDKIRNLRSIFNREQPQPSVAELLNSDLSDQEKILRIVTSKDSYSFFPFAFINFIRKVIKSSNVLLNEQESEIVIFLKNYFQNLDVNKKNQLAYKFDNLFKSYVIEFNSEYRDNQINQHFVNQFLEIISEYNFQNIIAQDQATPPPTPPPRPSTPPPPLRDQASNQIWSDFDYSSDVQNSSQSPSPYSSQGSSRSSSPPPPPPPRENPVFLGLTPESLLPLPIFIGESNESSELRITVMSKVVSNGAVSQDVNQGSSAIIVDHDNPRALFPLPIRLDSNDQKLLQLPQKLVLNGDQASQQNIDSSSVVSDHQNQGQGVDANDSAMKASTASSHITFVSPKRLGPEDSSIMPNGVSVEPLQPNLLASSIDQGNESSSDSNKEKSGEDGQGEQKINSCCSLFSRVCQRFRRFLSKIPSCSFKCFSASCLRSSKSRVEPRPLTP